MNMADVARAHQEHEANLFACELLMPASELKRLFPQPLSLMDDDMPIRNAAIRLKVPLVALVWWMTHLGLLEPEVGKHGYVR